MLNSTPIHYGPCPELLTTALRRRSCAGWASELFGGTLIAARPRPQCGSADRPDTDVRTCWRGLRPAALGGTSTTKLTCDPKRFSAHFPSVLARRRGGVANPQRADFPANRSPHMRADISTIGQAGRRGGDNQKGKGWYVTPQSRQLRSLAQAANRIRPAGKEPTDQRHRHCMAVLAADHLDAVRPAGISSTDGGTPGGPRLRVDHPRPPGSRWVGPSRSLPTPATATICSIALTCRGRWRVCGAMP